MTYQVIIEAPAQADIEEVYRRLAADSLEQAARWYNGLVDAITSLATLPQRCAFAPENAFFPVTTSLAFTRSLASELIIIQQAVRKQEIGRHICVTLTSHFSY
jgi:plasmid stabilization system protein ParE